MLSTSGMLKHVEANPDGEFIVATENGMLYPLQQAAPQANLIEANRMAFCKYMKMITLPKLRDSLRDMKVEVKVPPEIAERARRADRAHGRDRLTRSSGSAVARSAGHANQRPGRRGDDDRAHGRRRGPRRRRRAARRRQRADRVAAGVERGSGPRRRTRARARRRPRRATGRRPRSRG